MPPCLPIIVTQCYRMLRYPPPPPTCEFASHPSPPSFTMTPMPDLIHPWFQQHISIAQRVQKELAGQIEAVGQILIKSFAGGGKMITCGNGGSAADSQHFAEEMIGRFLRTR